MAAASATLEYVDARASTRQGSRKTLIESEVFASVCSQINRGSSSTEALVLAPSAALASESTRSLCTGQSEADSPPVRNLKIGVAATRSEATGTANSGSVEHIRVNEHLQHQARKAPRDQGRKLSQPLIVQAAPYAQSVQAAQQRKACSSNGLRDSPFARLSPFRSR